MRRTGSGWDRSFFLAVRKRHPRHPGLPEEGGAAGNDSQRFRRVRPLVAGGTPCRPFLLLPDLPNQERSSPPLLTVLLLLTAEHLEEVGGEKNERTGPLGWVGTPGVFFWHAAETKPPAASAGYRKTASVQPPPQEG